MMIKTVKQSNVLNVITLTASAKKLSILSEEIQGKAGVVLELNQDELQQVIIMLSKLHAFKSTNVAKDILVEKQYLPLGIYPLDLNSKEE